MKDNIKNEQTKRAFFNYLKESQGRSDSTIISIEQAILRYQECHNNEDFSLFNHKKAVTFKEWLKSRTFKGKSLSITSYYNYLRHLRVFFIWLSGEAGYKSKIAPASIDYLVPLKKRSPYGYSETTTAIPTA